MPTQAQAHISIFRAVVLAAVAALLSASAVLPLSAQSSVPATASQAAKMPQFASRLAHPATPRMSGKSPASAPDLRPSPGEGGSTYDNGPVNGQVDAWAINFGYQVSNSIQMSTHSTQSLSFWAWLIPGDTITNVQVSLGSQPFGSDLFNAAVDLSQSQCFTNEFGYQVCLETAGISGNTNLNGNAWITLQNANVPSGDPVYWDENSGVGCQSPGCPSQAQDNVIGTIPSEAFTVTGGSGPPSCNPSQESIPAVRSYTQQQPGASGLTFHNIGSLYAASSGDDSAGVQNRLAGLAASPLAALQWRHKVLHNFGNGSDGVDSSYGALIFDAAGNLYGTAPSGGTYGCGAVFELSPAQGGGWTETVLHSFNGTDGEYPENSLIFDAAGNLFGTTIYGGYGTVFELSPHQGGGWTETVLYQFTGLLEDGRYPHGNLIFDAAGNLYGTTSNGGIYCTLYQGCGTVFELSPTQGGGWTEQILYYFGNDGADNPTCCLVFDSAGNLYGMAEGGTGYGVVFELSPAQGGGWTQTLLYSFGPAPDGATPQGGLIFDAAGNLYGITRTGGTNAVGTVFELSPSGSGAWTEKVLHSFGNGTDGYQPLGNLILSGAGNLYGTTQEGGNTGGGTVFELSPDGGGGWSEAILHSFDTVADGYWPFAGVTFDSAGNLYGTTYFGGTYLYGTAFELTPIYPCIKCSHVERR